MGHYEKTKLKNNRDRKEEIQLKSTGNLFNNIIDKNSPNLKKAMHTRYKKFTEHHID